MTEWQGLALALGFGIGYNALIVKWAKSGWGEGFTAVWVVIGVAATLLISTMVVVPGPRLHFQWQGTPLLLTNQQHAAFYELKFFIAAGLPMFCGSLWRYLNNWDFKL